MSWERTAEGFYCMALNIRVAKPVRVVRGTSRARRLGAEERAKTVIDWVSFEKVQGSNDKSMIKIKEVCRSMQFLSSL